MEGKVYLTKESAVPIAERILQTRGPAKCLIIYHQRSRVCDNTLLWLAGTGARLVEFADYGKDAQAALIDDDQATMIVVGLSDMIRPSNRCDIRFEYMYNFAKPGAKYIIDHVPFLQEKWRVWYPYGVIDPAILLYPHSYAIESAYRNYEDGLTEDDPLDIGWIIDRVKAWTEIDYERYFDFGIEFEVHQTTADQRKGYAELKDKLFEECTTIKPIITGLAKFAQSICPERSIVADMRKLYKLTGDTTYHMTDLNVDWYLRGEIERVVTDTNRLTEGLHEAVSHNKRP
ncbi:MAG: hypothetical protein VB144_11340 [Clostridia bacterium]|nr:hypothetical protein [Clostridia bacterium]